MITTVSKKSFLVTVWTMLRSYYISSALEKGSCWTECCPRCTWDEFIMQQLVILSEDVIFKFLDTAVCNAAVEREPHKNSELHNSASHRSYYVTIITQKPPQHDLVGFQRSAGGTWCYDALIPPVRLSYTDRSNCIAPFCSTNASLISHHNWQTVYS